MGGGCRVGAQSAPRKIKKLIIHEGGAAPAELRELESRGTVMAAEKRLEQSTLSFVVNSASIYKLPLFCVINHEFVQFV